jgi:hypothetical protein
MDAFTGTRPLYGLWYACDVPEGARRTPGFWVQSPCTGVNVRWGPGHRHKAPAQASGFPPQERSQVQGPCAGIRPPIHRHHPCCDSSSGRCSSTARVAAVVQSPCTGVSDEPGSVVRSTRMRFQRWTCTRFIERMTGFEPATSTLARLRATNCATSACSGDRFRGSESCSPSRQMELAPAPGGLCDWFRGPNVGEGLPKGGLAPATQSGRRDSNPQPSPWEGDALPIAPHPHLLQSTDG